MFNYLNGIVAELSPNQAVIDCGGLGFQLNTSTYTAGSLKTGEKAKLYTFVHIREDLFDIYGFSTKNEKHLFELLIGVSGVGPKAAISILSCGTPEMLAMAVITGDERAITAAPGVGKKIAQRVILELKDKLAKETNEISFSGVGTAAPMAGGGERGEAAAALAALGYGSAEIGAVLKKLDTEGQSVEQIIKAALRQMMR